MLPGPAAGLEVVEHGLLPHLEALGVHEVAVGAGRVVAHHLQQLCSLNFLYTPPGTAEAKLATYS
jgi:hypothetical protein